MAIPRPCRVRLSRGKSGTEPHAFIGLSRALPHGSALGMGTVLVILGLCVAHLKDPRRAPSHARRRRGGHVHCPSRSRLPRAAAASAAMALLRRGPPTAPAAPSPPVLAGGGGGGGGGG